MSDGPLAQVTGIFVRRGERGVGVDVHKGHRLVRGRQGWNSAAAARKLQGPAEGSCRRPRKGPALEASGAVGPTAAGTLDFLPGGL